MLYDEIILGKEYHLYINNEEMFYDGTVRVVSKGNVIDGGYIIVDGYKYSLRVLPYMLSKIPTCECCGQEIRK